MTAPDAPRWTPARLRMVLTAIYGKARTGDGPDVQAIADDFGTSTSTVYRWLRQPDDGRLVAIPDRRLATLMTRQLPTRETLAQEQVDRDNYAEAIVTLSTPRLRRDANPAWRERQWDQPHVVILKHHDDRRLFQLRSTRIGSSTAGRARRGGTIVAEHQAPTYFHAAILIHTILTDLQAWRVNGPRSMEARTYCWFDDAPAVDLATQPVDYRPQRVIDRDGPLPSATAGE